MHLRLTADAGDVQASWIRRSRTGYGWPGCVDAPLGEAVEAYRVTVTLDGRIVRTDVTDTAGYNYSMAARLADGGGAAVTIAVAQMSASVGPGAATAATIIP